MARGWRAIIGLIGIAGAMLAGAPALASDAAKPQVTAGMPAEFADLSKPHLEIVDVWFGGVRLGQFELTVTPSAVRFAHPELVAAAIPDLIGKDQVTRALSGDLDPNSRFVCTGDAQCAHPSPQTAAVVYDALHFRIELFVAANLLPVRTAAVQYLQPFEQAPSAVDTIGVALAGGGGAPLAYNIRNRVVVGVGSGRLVSEASLSSGRGLNIDTAAGELDRPNLRYIGGLFYAPGPDLVGRRRIVGIGVGTQFDTRIDRMALTGSPMVVFLAVRSRVDVYVQGRLVGSHVFEAGNQSLDTSSLPDGSYPVELRIQEASGAIRTEQRFFTKSAALAPIGRIVFHASAGMLAVDRMGSPIALAKVPLFTGDLAGRFRKQIAWDGALIATDRKALTEIGVTFLSNIVQVRIAVMGSSSGDRGAILQVGSTGSGPLSINFDLRHVRSPSTKPLIPFDDYILDSFSGTDLNAQRLASSGGTYTQAIGSLIYHVASGQIGASGYYRRSAFGGTTYAVGPTVRWRVYEANRLQLIFNGAYAATNRGRSMAFGLQLQLQGKRSTISATGGAQSVADNDRRLESVSEVTGTIQRENVLGAEVAAAATVQRAGDYTTVQGSIDTRSRAGFASVTLLDRFGRFSSGMQYGLTGQTSIAIGKGGVRIGARDQNDAILSVGVKGDASDTPFDVVVDDAVLGQIRAGQHLTLAVTPYRRYKVRLRAVGTQLVSFDTKSRIIDAFPGTVAALNWRVDPVLAMFGRLVGLDGLPVVNADITTDGAIGATDDRGYFQLQAAGNARIVVHRAGGQTCTATLNAKATVTGYTPLGDVKCI